MFQKSLKHHVLVTSAKWDRYLVVFSVTDRDITLLASC
jgi:hypothetical protein